MEISSCDFCKLTLNEVSDLLLEQLSETGNATSNALLMGVDNDGRHYNLKVSLELMEYE
jgi:hypothetical protein